MEVRYSLSSEHLRQLHQLYQNEWWTKGRTLEETIDGLNGSQLCVGIVDSDENLIAFARVLSDFVFKALIFDIIVAPYHRNSGLGDKLVTLVKEHPGLAKVKHFELYCLPELIPFYSCHGFSSDVSGVQLMRYQP